MNKTGRFLIFVGCLLIAAALGLTAYNLVDEARAGKSADQALSQLAIAMSSIRDASTTTGNDTLAAPPPFTTPTTSSTTDIPSADQANDEPEMPVIQLDGQEYAGILSIPSLSLELPVLRNWSMAALKNAPCCYAGSLYQNNLVIAGHNYKGHFGKLSDLQIGDSIFFTDARGKRFRYEVVEMESLPANAVDDMTEGDWDFTLFTCTVGGRSRLTVRCVLTES